MRFGLIGEKLGHSFSKEIHESMGKYEYHLWEVPKDELDSFMKKADFDGINVTIPYKQAVIPYLDEIDDAARAIGAVNTVVRRGDKLCGYNTDFGGMKMLIERCGFDYSGKKVLILGSGGTSKTACAVAKSLGAAEVITVSRGGCVHYENVLSLHGDADYIINTTPVGMYPNNGVSAVEVADFPSLQGVTDVVYNPLKTKLCLDCERHNIKSEGGLYMLVAQAVLAYEIFTESKLDAFRVTDEIYRQIKKDKQNIVLIGMPGSGKSTIGKALAKKLGRAFLDTDDMITEKYGVIAELFDRFGEAYFRDRESEAVAEAGKGSGTVIATGGGAVLRRENIDALRQNGMIFFLNRPLEDIRPTEDRPLARDREALKKRFEERYAIYSAAADEEILVDGKVANSVNQIMECL
ncbi:MAG: shikimate kinase [Oscillospiraceae bacterium]|nr:shikimate kinase [Oscillospiraceae bacterium]